MRPVILNFSKIRSLSAAFVGAAFVFASANAHAEPGRVAVIGPDSSPIVARLQRNVAAMHMEAVTATANVCTRDVITRLLGQLRVTAALCADGDSVAIWALEQDHVVLKNVIVAPANDDRAQEVTAARAAMALRSMPAKDSSPADAASANTAGGFTIVANGPDGAITTNTTANAPDGSNANANDPSGPPAKDAPAIVRRPQQQPERMTSTLILGAGPGTTSSHHGTSFALSFAGEIGVSRYVTLSPWFSYVPSNRTAEQESGTAIFRPTIFGLGFGIPILKPSSFVVPRIGGGYALLWMHVQPDAAVAPAQTKKPEDLLAPMIYTSVGLSFRVSERFRIVGEGLLAVSSHDMVVRIAGATAAEWGVPVANLSARAEWVLP